jgi:hypothetical protein
VGVGVGVGVTVWVGVGVGVTVWVGVGVGVTVWVGVGVGVTVWVGVGVGVGCGCGRRAVVTASVIDALASARAVWSETAAARRQDTVEALRRAAVRAEDRDDVAVTVAERTADADLMVGVSTSTDAARADDVTRMETVTR